MKSSNPLKSALALVGALACAATATASVTYTTTFTGTSNAEFTPALERIEFHWTTAVPLNNVVSVGDLSNLSIFFYDESDALVFTDHAIIGGAAQPISGITRVIGDITFDAILGTTVEGTNVTSFDNAGDASLLNGSTGTTYNIYGPAAQDIIIAVYRNGALDGDGALFTFTGQTTSAIPEPSAYAAFAGLGALGLAVARRRARA